MEGRLCVVTGATDGIGRVTARALAERGVEVVLVGRNAAKGAEVCKAIRRSSRNDRVRFEQADLSSQAEIRALAERLTAGGTAIDVLVNNVGALFTRRRRERRRDRDDLRPQPSRLLPADRSAAGEPDGKRRGPHRQRRLRGPSRCANEPWTTRKGRRATAAGAPISRASSPTFSSRIASRRCCRGRPSRRTACTPGFVASKFGQNNGWLFVTILKTLMRFSAIDVEAGARTSVHVATGADVAGVSGRYFDKCREATSSLASRDEESGRRPVGAEREPDRPSLLRA